MKLYNFNKFILEQYNNKVLKYYMFDWDDNLLYMPTKIKMLDNTTNEVIELSTEEFAERRNDPNLSYFDGSFLEFRDTGPRKDKAFEEDFQYALKNKRFAPSWNDFIECLVNASLFAIITARGHNPESIKNAVRYIIHNVLSEDQYEIMIDNIKSFIEFFDTELEDDQSLIDNYLDNCSFYPVSHESIYTKFGLQPTQVELLKKECILDFVNNVKSHNKGKGTIVKFGFSDDDKKNVEIINNFLKGEEGLDLSIYQTTKGKIKI